MSPNELTAISAEYGDTNYIQELTEVAVKISINNFEWRFITFVFINTTLMQGVELFLNIYKGSVIVSKGTFYPRFADKCSQFVLFVDDVQSMATNLDWMDTHQFYNTGKYIVVCMFVGQQECDESRATQILWDHKVINVVFLKKERIVDAYTYLPIHDNNCNNVLVKLNTTIPINLSMKKLRNLKKCKLIVSTFQQLPFMDLTDGKPKGADGDLLNIIGEGLNAQIEVITPHIGDGWGSLNENGTWSGSLAHVYHDLANFSMTSASLSRKFIHFQMSEPYYSSSVIWISPPAVLTPASFKLLHPFQPTVQVVLAFSFFLIILCAFVTKTKIWSSFSNTIKLSRPHSIIFHSWRICTGLSMPKLPKNPTFLYMVVVWMWYCFLIRTLYQVYLINSLQGNFYYGEFSKMKDVVKANYPFGGGGGLKDYYNDEPAIHDNWIDIDRKETLPMLVNVSKGMDFVLAMNMESAMVTIKEKRLPVHILSEKVVASPTVIIFKKFSPLEDSVSNVLRRLTETGFSDKFFKNYAISKKDGKEEFGYRAITVENFTGCYVILICGWVTSTIIFLFEIYCGKFYKKSKGRKVCP